MSVRTASDTAISRRRLMTDCSGPGNRAAAPARAALMTRETTSKNASAKTRPSEKTRDLSQAQIGPAPLVGADWTSQIRFIVVCSSPKTAVAPITRVTRLDGGPQASLRVRGRENARDELPTRLALEAFELGSQLTGHPLPSEYHPGHAGEEQHQRRQ